jgi:hypothetical protein
MQLEGRIDFQAWRDTGAGNFSNLSSWFFKLAKRVLCDASETAGSKPLIRWRQ